MVCREPIRIMAMGGVARIEPVDPVKGILDKHASFNRRVPLVAGRGRGRRFEFVRNVLFVVERDPSTGGEYALTYTGLLPELVEEMQHRGLTVESTVQPTGMKHHQPDFTWAHRQRVVLRDGQLRMLEAVIKYERAQLVGITALGKSYLIRVLVHCFPQPDCRIVIAAPSLSLMHAYLDELRPDFPIGEVGQLGGNRKETQARIVVSTFDSLENVDPARTNILFVDEAHECGTEDRTKLLSSFVRSRVYGFTASAKCRSDGADRAVEAIFGKPLTDVTYAEGVEEGYLPEVDCYFYRCMAQSPSSSNQTTRERLMIWRNRLRNATIAGICRYWEKRLFNENGTEPQIMVLVSTVEHMFYLRQELPDYTPIYSNMSPKLRERLVLTGVIRPEHRYPTTEQRMELMRQLVDGKLRKIIAQIRTGTGTDTRHLDVLVRADGKSSEVGNIQYRGRVMRGKRGVCRIYADVLDYGDHQLEMASRTRYRSARKIGLKPKVIELWEGHRQVAYAER
jgi:superfamily II DNA or RNA helicase